jgi:hypothetical protein
MEISRVEDLVGLVLRKEFSDFPSKQSVSKSLNRLNICCPYCGDSKNHRKKRGNFYLDTLTYKCYNGGCGIFKDSISFFKDFGIYESLSGGEKREIIQILDENKNKRNNAYGKIDFSFFVDNDFDSILIDRNEFCSKLGLIDVDKSKIIVYIKRRHQTPDSRFAWDPKKERIFLPFVTSMFTSLSLFVSMFTTQRYHGLPCALVQHTKKYSRIKKIENILYLMF